VQQWKHLLTEAHAGSLSMNMLSLAAPPVLDTGRMTFNTVMPPVEPLLPVNRSVNSDWFGSGSEAGWPRLSRTGPKITQQANAKPTTRPENNGWKTEHTKKVNNWRPT
jgi:hypothetical protein